MSKGKGRGEVTWQRERYWRGGWTKGCIWRGAALKHQSAAGWLSGRHLSCQLSPPALVRRDTVHHWLLFFYFHISLWGWERWAICCKCMMNFIKYSQLLLKITGDLQNRNPTYPEQIWHTEQRCEICQKLKVVLVTSGPLWFIFLFLSRTWFYWNNDSYMFYSCAF